MIEIDEMGDYIVKLLKETAQATSIVSTLDGLVESINTLTSLDPAHRDAIIDALGGISTIVTVSIIADRNENVEGTS